MTIAQDITRHYGGDWHGSYGAFPTPGHGRTDRGMTVTDAPDAPDGVLVHSFNGGDPLAVKDECRRVGLLPEREQSNDCLPRQTAQYEYVDGDGVVLYRTVRIEQVGKKKRFQAQRPDGRGGWSNGIGDVARVLYRLPEIKSALSSGEMPRVFLVEGERKADKLASWGLVATACAFGCKDWRKAYADGLAGCQVVILPDNDDEGRAFAERAASDISKAGGTAHIVELPGLPVKGDIIDWSGTADDLAQLVDTVLAPVAATFQLADLAQWGRTDPRPKSFIMPGYIPARELTLATGAGGANKSTFGQQLATCVAAGVRMLGIDVMQGNALYITAEDDEERLHWMQKHICDAVGVGIAALAGRLHLASLRGRLGNELATFDAENKLRPSPSFQMLRATIEQSKAQLVVLDNAAHLFAGNENDRQQVTAFVNLLYSLCQDLGATVILVAHSNKAGDTYSGSTAWLNAVRSQIVLARPEDSHDPDERLLTLGKANYARQGQELRFRWHNFALILNDQLPEDTRAAFAANAAASGANEAFIACLRARDGQGDGRRVGPSPGPNYAPSQFEGMPQAKHYKKADLKRAMDRLFEVGRIKSVTFRDTAKGRDVTVIEEAPQGTPNAPPNASRTLSPNHPEPAENGPRAHTVYTTYIGGAATGAAAPTNG